MIEPRFLDLMPVTVEISGWLRNSTDGYATPKYGTATSYRARVGFAKRMEFNADSQSLTPIHTAWLATTAAIDVRSRFRYLGTTYRMVRVDLVANGIGAHHTKIELMGG